MRAFLLLILFFSPTPAAFGSQVYSLAFKSPRLEKKYRRQIVEIQGRRGILVEIKKGPELVDQVFQVSPRERYEFYVANPGDPAALPYKIKNGKRFAVGKKGVLAIQGADIASLALMMPTESFASLATEYAHRKQEIADLKRTRESFPRGSQEWFAAQQLMLRADERLRNWLDGNGYVLAATKMDREIDRQRRIVSKDARSQRLKGALASIQEVDVPQELQDAAAEIADGAFHFRGLGSRHFLIYSVDTHSEARLRHVLELAETALEGFREAYVDPYFGEDFPDRIPEKRFEEFFFGPPGPSAYAAFFEDYYGYAWGPRKAERLKMKGTAVDRGPGRIHFLEYWRTDGSSSLEGIVLHRLGHALAELNYLGHGAPVSNDWLREALGYALSFENLGRNDVVCVAFEDPSKRYARQGPSRGAAGKKEVQEGLRDYFRELALSDPQPLSSLMLQDLYDLKDEDIAKGWSLFDYLGRKGGKPAQLWLRALGKSAVKGKGKFLEDLRKPTEELLGDGAEGDVFQVVERRWRAYAAGETD